MNDTLQVLKNVIKDPVPAVNTVVIFGMTAMEWELFFTVVLGFASVVWTVVKIINEWVKFQNLKNETSDKEKDK